MVRKAKLKKYDATFYTYVSGGLRIRTVKCVVEATSKSQVKSVLRYKYGRIWGLAISPGR